MGFPQRRPEGPTSRSFVGQECKLQSGGFTCPRCAALVAELPSSCHVCGLTLVSSPHLARSYHHLFPIKPFVEVTLEALTQAMVAHQPPPPPPPPPPRCCSLAELLSSCHVGNLILVTSTAGPRLPSACPLSILKRNHTARAHQSHGEASFPLRLASCFDFIKSRYCLLLLLCCQGFLMLLYHAGAETGTTFRLSTIFTRESGIRPSPLIQQQLLGIPGSSSEAFVLLRY